MEIRFSRHNWNEKQPDSLSLREATQARQVLLWGQEALPFGRG